MNNKIKFNGNIANYGNIGYIIIEEEKWKL